METIEKYEQDLFSLYWARHFRTISQKSRALHVVCSNSETCWRNIEGTQPDPEGEKSHLSRPWIGPHYDRIKLMALGVNMNNHGGYDAIVWLTNYAKEAVSKGARRINFGDPSYKGTLLYHRMACYAAAFLSQRGIIKVDWDGGKMPTGDQLSKAFDYISFTNHIKCSPVSQLSEPPWEMWKNCGKHVLKEELAILRPSHLLVLGASANAFALCEYVFAGDLVFTKDFGANSRNRVRTGRLSLGGEKCQVYVVPHPQAQKYRFAEVLCNLREALGNLEVPLAN